MRGYAKRIHRFLFLLIFIEACGKTGKESGGGSAMGTLKNGTLWKDVSGAPLHAHGGYIIFYEGYY